MGLAIIQVGTGTRPAGTSVHRPVQLGPAKAGTRQSFQGTRLTSSGRANGFDSQYPLGRGELKLDSSSTGVWEGLGWADSSCLVGSR